MGIPRSLSLHESALSPAEYSAYVPLFTTLVEPPDTSIGVRELRGWLKGRYSSLEGTTIDKILRLFYPALASTDHLAQGQFYAVLRLLGHVTAGQQADPALIFVQPPESATTLHQSTTRSEPPNTNPISGVSGVHNSNNPFTARSNQATPAPTNRPTDTTTKPTGRPFSNSISNSASALSSDEGSIPEYATIHNRASSSPAPSIPNPFIARANSIPQSMAVPPTLPVNPSSVVPPALPPRKPSFLPPPRHASQQPAGSTENVSVGSSATSILLPSKDKSKEPPAKPPKPPVHVTSPLIKQGLLAAKGAQRSAELGLDKLRTWEIIKTSNNNPNPSAGGRTISTAGLSLGNSLFGGRSPSAERDGDRTTVNRERSASTSSSNDRSTPRIHSTTRHMRNGSHAPELPQRPEFASTTHEEPLEEEDGPFGSPALSPPAPSSAAAMKPSVTTDTILDSPTTNPAFRVSRSKSLHSSTSGTPPLPPPRRKRPESIQVSPSVDGPVAPWSTSEAGGTITGRRKVPIYTDDEERDGPFGDSESTTAGSVSAQSDGAAFAKRGGKRHSTAGFGHSGTGLDGTIGHSSTVASLQRQFENLHMKTRPSLESARAKVEGKLIPGGYGKWGAEHLTSSPVKSTTSESRNGAHMRKSSSEESDDFHDANDLPSTDDDVWRNGWKPLRG